MLQMNLITRKELYGELYGEEYGELDWEVNWELSRELYWGLNGEVYSPLGDQIRIDFHNSKFRGYNTICYK